MSVRSVVVAMVAVAVFGASGSAQDPKPEALLEEALKATVKQGFLYTIRPSANIPDSMPKERQALAGVPVYGAYSKGLYHASDGTFEIYRKDSNVAVATNRGWLPIDQFTSPLRQEVAKAFDDTDGKMWKRGNVTAGRKALHQLIQISHLSQRTNVDRLEKLGLAFSDLRAWPSKKHGTFFEGELTDATAFELLQGPFAALIERGTLSLKDVSGAGRVYVNGGVVRRIVFRATGFYTYYEENDNTQKRGKCSLEVVGELSKHGEVKIELPTEVWKLFQR